jgi:hypothetical protein
LTDLGEPVSRPVGPGWRAQFAVRSAVIGNAAAHLLCAVPPISSHRRTAYAALICYRQLSVNAPRQSRGPVRRRSLCLAAMINAGRRQYHRDAIHVSRRGRNHAVTLLTPGEILLGIVATPLMSSHSASATSSTAIGIQLKLVTGPRTSPASCSGRPTNSSTEARRPGRSRLPRRGRRHRPPSAAWRRAPCSATAFRASRRCTRRRDRQQSRGGGGNCADHSFNDATA